MFDASHQELPCTAADRTWAASRAAARRKNLSGYPSQAESDHDLVELPTASTASPTPTDWPRPTPSGEERHVVAVIKDGALTGEDGLRRSLARHRRRQPAGGDEVYNDAAAWSTRRPSGGSC
ncbi:MAG: 1-deoxy-D-xylulose-5-phosphate synthase N-terminal domain-containing protein [Nocardioides sp.]